jgi:hypothetical protein
MYKRLLSDNMEAPYKRTQESAQKDTPHER